jgi:hypothetical protein
MFLEIKRYVYCAEGGCKIGVKAWIVRSEFWALMGTVWFLKKIFPPNY